MEIDYSNGSMVGNASSMVTCNIQNNTAYWARYYASNCKGSTFYKEQLIFNETIYNSTCFAFNNYGYNKQDCKGPFYVYQTNLWSYWNENICYNFNQGGSTKIICNNTAPVSISYSEINCKGSILNIENYASCRNEYGISVLDILINNPCLK